MRNAETVLSIIRERGKLGLPLQRIYRLLYNPDLYLRAYARLYPNKGAMTPGSTPETVMVWRWRKSNSSSMTSAMNAIAGRLLDGCPFRRPTANAGL